MTGTDATHSTTGRRTTASPRGATVRSRRGLVSVLFRSSRSSKRARFRAFAFHRKLIVVGEDVAVAAPHVDDRPVDVLRGCRAAGPELPRERLDAHLSHAVS